jgi:ankyrin repeat protein
MRLSIEIVEEILIYLPFELSIKVHLGSYIKKYNAFSLIWLWAIFTGYIEVIKWLHENRIEGCIANAMDFAAGGGYLDVVKYIHENRPTQKCTKEAMDWAAKNGHLEVIKWLHENRHEGCTTRAMVWANKNGHVEVVKYLKEHYPEL